MASCIFSVFYHSPHRFLWDRPAVTLPSSPPPRLFIRTPLWRILIPSLRLILHDNAQSQFHTFTPAYGFVSSLEQTLSFFALPELLLPPSLRVFICVISDHSPSPSAVQLHPSLYLTLFHSLSFLPLLPITRNLQSSYAVHLSMTFWTELPYLFLSHCRVDWNPLWPVIYIADHILL